MQMVKKKICFIANPVSGSRKSQNINRRFLEKHLDMQKYDFDIMHTRHKGHGMELARDAMANGFDVITAVGGDGTVSEIGSVMIGSDKTMAIIPTGSGNGFSRDLGIPMKLQGALDVINGGKVRTVDTGKIRSQSPGNDGEWTPFLSNAGIGFDAYMSDKFDKLEKRGLWSYIKAIWQEYWSYEMHEYRLVVDGKEVTRESWLITFANATQYGNNATIAPHALLDDGLFDVCIVTKFPNWKLPMMLYRFFNRSIDKSGYLEVIRGKSIQVYKDLSYAQIDGDFISLNKNIEVEIEPLSLNVVVPK
jgi:YegS/Rv2252/BmrU family lipid kinase